MASSSGRAAKTLQHMRLLLQRMKANKEGFDQVLTQSVRDDQGE